MKTKRKKKQHTNSSTWSAILCKYKFYIPALITLNNHLIGHSRYPHICHIYTTAELTISKIFFFFSFLTQRIVFFFCTVVVSRHQKNFSWTKQQKFNLFVFIVYFEICNNNSSHRVILFPNFSNIIKSPCMFSFV